jgi:MYXO-CTERM domain-containing protein
MDFSKTLKPYFVAALLGGGSLMGLDGMTKVAEKAGHCDMPATAMNEQILGEVRERMKAPDHNAFDSLAYGPTAQSYGTSIQAEGLNCLVKRMTEGAPGTKEALGGAALVALGGLLALRRRPG